MHHEINVKETWSGISRSGVWYFVVHNKSEAPTKWFDDKQNLVIAHNHNLQFTNTS